MGNGNKTEYLYDAAGQKRRAAHSVVLNSMQIPLGETTMENITNISSISTRDYCDNFVYLNGVVERINTPDGYILANNTSPSNWKRVYYIKDHLGNVRTEMISSSLSVSNTACSRRSFASYYPYGMEIAYLSGSLANVSPNQFGGNELERTNTQYHDFNFRWYDQQLGRFISQDPLAAMDYSVSPYAYCANNPINFIDPLGLKTDTIHLPEVTVIGHSPFWGSFFSASGGIGTFIPDPETWERYLWSLEIERRKEEYKGRMIDHKLKEGDLSVGYYNVQGGSNFADYVELAGDLGGPIGSGAKNILDNRGLYMPRGQIYNMNNPVTVRTPIVNLNTTSKALNYTRLGGKILVVGGVVATGYQVGSDISDGNYYSAGARAVVFGVAAGSAFIPVVGWGIAAGIGVADFIWGEQFYYWVETKMGD